jgi:hypothetical protein
MRLMEIGRSHSPLIPKRDEWATCVVDHATRSELLGKCKYSKEVARLVEDIDVVWREKFLHVSIPMADYGTFDAIVTSQCL